MRSRAISSEFSIHRVSQRATLCNFQKKIPLHKNEILNFLIVAKMEKNKFASISLTVRDRAISSKFLTHRVSPQPKCAIFGGHLEFLHKTQKRIYLGNGVR